MCDLRDIKCQIPSSFPLGTHILQILISFSFPPSSEHWEPVSLLIVGGWEKIKSRSPGVRPDPATSLLPAPRLGSFASRGLVGSPVKRGLEQGRLRGTPRGAKLSNSPSKCTVRCFGEDIPERMLSASQSGSPLWRTSSHGSSGAVAFPRARPSPGQRCSDTVRDGAGGCSSESAPPCRQSPRWPLAVPNRSHKPRE